MNIGRISLVALFQSHLETDIATTRPRNSILDKFLLESSQQTVNIHSTNAAHAKKGYIPFVYAPQESTNVHNVSVINLPVLKTIFPHQAEFS